MAIQIDNAGFKQAEALLSDSIFLLNFDRNSPKDLKLYKLLRARQENPDFEMALAEFVCGESNNSFPYRSSYFLTRFFTDLGFEYIHDGTTRRFWVKDVLLQMPIKELSVVIEKGIFNKRDFRKEAKEKGQDFEENYEKAIKEFKDVFNDSLTVASGVDLSYLLDFNVNTELLFDEQVQTEDDELNKLIKEAKERFFNPKDKQIAIEKLWDAFERIKTYYDGNKKQSSAKLVSVISENFNSEFFESEFIVLTKIGNDYRIRHHETDKKEINEIRHLNYLFFRMLSLITLCLSSIDET
ncbi:MAG: hypothetical protein WD824_04615 [Cyclobacteriaceae bacterium]